MKCWGKYCSNYYFKIQEKYNECVIEIIAEGKLSADMWYILVTTHPVAQRHTDAHTHTHMHIYTHCNKNRVTESQTFISYCNLKL